MVAFSRIIPLTGVRNFRDLGGLPTTDGRKTRWGRLFRSGHLNELPDDMGMEMLARGIETVIDFRTDAEKQRRPVHWPAMWQPNYVAIPVGGNAAAWVQELMERLAHAEFPAQELRDKFLDAFRTLPVAHVADIRRFFDTLVASDAGVTLFHCTAGKDRTGVAAALLQYALGVEDDAIMDHFMLTNKAVDLDASAGRLANILTDKAGRQIRAADITPLVGVEEAFLDAMWTAVESEFGSRETYLREALNITDEKRTILKDRYLQG